MAYWRCCQHEYQIGELNLKCMKNFNLKNEGNNANTLLCAINITDMVWKVEYYKSDIDRLKDIKTIDEFDNFESAKDFTIMQIGNHMGAVRLIHPNVC